MDDILFEESQKDAEGNQIQIEVQHQHYVDEKRERTSKFVLPREERADKRSRWCNTCSNLANSVDIPL